VVTANFPRLKSDFARVLTARGFRNQSARQTSGDQPMNLKFLMDALPPELRQPVLDAIWKYCGFEERPPRPEEVRDLHRKGKRKAVRIAAE
jgi:hypothetical protein